MDLASLRKEHSIKRGQLAMLQAGMSRSDRHCTSDDMPTDLAAEYADGGKWVGPAVQTLALARIIERIGNAKSARPSRHATEVKRWRVRDDHQARLYAQALRLWLERNPLPPEPDDDAGMLFPTDPTPTNNGSPAVAAAGLR
jgi:hypothetical protein